MRASDAAVLVAACGGLAGLRAFYGALGVVVAPLFIPTQDSDTVLLAEVVTGVAIGGTL